MFENIAAIDIGTSSIKVVTVKTGLKDFQVRSFAFEDIDQDNKNIDEAVSESLSRITEGTGIKGYTILTNLPMEKAIIRNIKFPFKDVEKIAEAIPYEAEENIPFKLDDIILDFQPIKSTVSEEGRVLLTVAHKESIHDFLKSLKEQKLDPIRMNLESQALFECYRYFNKIEDETIIQLDIGHSKTIINIIQNDNLQYTRSVSVGVGLIYKKISEINKISYSEAINIFENLNLDVSSFENNIHREHYRTYNLNKNELKLIYDDMLEIIYELIEQIVLTEKAFFLDFGKIEFNRVLISGGGSNIMGIGSIISKELELPVISLPFLEDYKESRIQTQFPIAFGCILLYINKKQSAINFLKDDFLPERVSASRNKYYLSGAFILLSIMILIINIISTSYLKSELNNKYNDELNKRIKVYFPDNKISKDPFQEAMNILKEEKKEFDNIDTLIHTNDRILDILKDILSFFPDDESFELNNMVINERIIRIDGRVSSSRNIDEFKNKLIESNKFDNVTLNSNIKKTTLVSFSMTIKLKAL